MLVKSALITTYQNTTNMIDTDDEEMLDFIFDNVNLRKQYTVRRRENNFAKWTDSEFFMRFRMSKNTVLYLLDKIENQLLFLSDRNHAVSSINQLLITLRFYATGCMLISVGDFAGVHKSTACRIIQRVTQAIVSLAPEFIKFPRSPDEIMQSQQEFYRIARFPRVTGCIDCTHVKIQSPGGENAEYFRNRKGYFSINVQAICDANLKIIDIVSRWPGSTHDSQIFRNSRIFARFESGQMGDGLLLGDSGYPVKKYLITPLLNSRSQQEQLFNESQIRTRNVIERCFGVWKRRFPILSLGMRVKLTTVQDIIVATAILQNICRQHLEEEPLEDPDLNIQIEENEVNNTNNEEVDNDDSVRNSLINDYFARFI